MDFHQLLDDLREVTNQIRDKCIKERGSFKFKYLKSLPWKFQSIEYHSHQYKTALDGKTASYANQPDWHEADFIAEVNTIAAMQNLHSMTDILAQFINEALPGKRLSEEGMSLAKLVQHLEEEKQYPDLQRTLKQIKESQDYRLVQAFSNTTKHRSLLQRNYQEEHAAEYNDIHFEGFQYNNVAYPAILAAELFDNKTEELVKLMIAALQSAKQHLSQ